MTSAPGQLSSHQRRILIDTLKDCSREIAEDVFGYHNGGGANLDWALVLIDDARRLWESDQISRDSADTVNRLRNLQSALQILAGDLRTGSVSTAQARLGELAGRFGSIGP